MPKLPEPTAGDTGWFVHDRFGLFIHWGIYSAAGLSISPHAERQETGKFTWGLWRG